MSSELTLALQDDIPLEVLAGILVDAGFSPPEAEDGLLGCSKDGCEALLESKSERNRLAYQETAGMPSVPKSFATFLIDRRAASFEDAQSSCYAAIHALLRHTACDASLHFDIEGIYLRRVAGALTLYQGEGRYTDDVQPNLLQGFDGPYTLVEEEFTAG
jgi:hypothetical protein